jgi:cellulose biosynthesis protein BcsQ
MLDPCRLEKRQDGDPMKIVSFIGEKGGVGKTTNAHATAHGLSMLGIPAAYVMTDRRELLSDEHRVYAILDGRSVPKLEGTIATARGQGSRNGVYVMDGGASRAAVDDLLMSVSDLVILPFTADDDSNYVVTEEMQKFPEALAMPSNWTTNSKAADVDAGYIEKLEALYPGRILPPTPNTHSVRDFLLQNFNGKVLPPAQRYCRTLARRIIDILEVERVDEKAA